MRRCCGRQPLSGLHQPVAHTRLPRQAPGCPCRPEVGHEPRKPLPTPRRHPGSTSWRLTGLPDLPELQRLAGFGSRGRDAIGYNFSSSLHRHLPVLLLIQRQCVQLSLEVIAATMSIPQTYSADLSCSDSWPISLYSLGNGNTFGSGSDWSNYQPSETSALGSPSVKVGEPSCADHTALSGWRAPCSQLPTPIRRTGPSGSGETSPRIRPAARRPTARRRTAGTVAGAMARRSSPHSTRRRRPRPR